MLRGEVWRVDFDPSLGGEIQKILPAMSIQLSSPNTKSSCLNSRRRASFNARTSTVARPDGVNPLMYASWNAKCSCHRSRRG